MIKTRDSEEGMLIGGRMKLQMPPELSEFPPVFEKVCAIYVQIMDAKWDKGNRGTSVKFSAVFTVESPIGSATHKGEAPKARNISISKYSSRLLPKGYSTLRKS